MLTEMKVYSQRLTVPELLLGSGGASSDPIQVRNVVGLGPVKATVNTTPYASVDGESYRGSITGKRNIVITFGLNPSWEDQTIESLRHLLYAYFMPKQMVKLRFSSPLIVDCEISGYVESLEPNMFLKDPEVQVSVICPLPDFVAVEPTVVTGVVVTDGATDTDIDYEGTLPTGFVLEVETSEANESYVGSLTIINKTPSPSILHVPNTAVDDLLYFKMSTVRGKRFINRVSVNDGAFLNLLRTIPNPVWPQLELGVNEFTVVGEEAGQIWTLTYYIRYGGL